jgi:ssDNA-binding Zn-finger/Zn-ribbon topoisomerase 1|tara:strand:+ start:531 stop:755 length:225 start_codon:yes stop_codon:yes gene_type:complete
MDNKTPEDLWDENILGEESFGKFYTGNGFTALNYIIQKKPEALDSIKIIDEKRKSYTVTEFLDTVKDWKIMLDN